MTTPSERYHNAGNPDRPPQNREELRPAQWPSAKREIWDAFVTAESESIALFQLWSWGEFKERLGWKAVRIGVSAGDELVAAAQILIKSAPFNLFSVAYLPRGPVGSWTEPRIKELLFSELSRVCRREGCAFLRVEPAVPYDSDNLSVFRQFRYRTARHTNNPRATILVDLDGARDSLWEQMNESTRRNIRRANRAGLQVRMGGLDDLRIFYSLMVETGRRAGFHVRHMDYYASQVEAFSKGGNLGLFLALYHGQPIACNVSGFCGRHAVNLHLVSSDEHRDLCANAFLMSEALHWAQSSGCKTFDLWGVPDEVGLAKAEDRPFVPGRGGLWGVVQFKLGFSKRAVLYAPAQDRVFSSVPYRLVNNPFLSSERFEHAYVWLDRLLHRPLRMADGGYGSGRRINPTDKGEHCEREQQNALHGRPRLLSPGGNPGGAAGARTHPVRLSRGRHLSPEGR